MKLIFVISHLLVFTGGGKFVLDYANGFCEKGHNVIVVSQKIDQNIYKFNKKIWIIELGGPLPSNPLHWFKLKKIKKKFFKVLNRLDSDLIISSTGFPSNYFCVDINTKTKLKHVNYCHEPFRFFHDKEFYLNAPFFLKIFSYLLRILFKKYDIECMLATDEIICNSNFTRKRVKKIYGKNAIVQHLGIDIHENMDKLNDFVLEKELKLKKNTPIIFTLGLTHHLKGAKELIYIFDKILREIPETVLLVGGWIKKENEVIIKKLIKKLRIPHKNVIFYGFIEKEQIDCFYSNSTLTFYTAKYEAYGYIPIESMKNGTPVIAFEGGPSDTIKDGQTGYIIKNFDLDEFAQKAINLIKDNELRKKFSENAKLHCKENFSFEKCFSNLEITFQKIIINVKNSIG